MGLNRDEATNIGEQHAIFQIISHAECMRGELKCRELFAAARGFILELHRAKFD